jgi:2-polyprenyl-3-methyl-5-hydroxy-6-metoxy-1,4-benzoquinol methylase
MSGSERVQSFFDRYAGNFSAIYDKPTPARIVINKLFRKSMRLRYVRTLEGCRPLEGRTVLDAGCGSGVYSVALAEGGAARVTGIDFATAMIRLAAARAQASGVGGRCEFKQADFFDLPDSEIYDYVILTGFMDYVADPAGAVEKALRLTRSRAFFSFPADGGIFAWHRRRLYRARCELFLYREPQVRKLFSVFPEFQVKIDRLARDFFVSASRVPGTRRA